MKTIDNKATASVFVFGIVLVFTSLQCKGPENKDEQEMELPTVRYEIVSTESISIPVSASGILGSQTQSKLSFLTGGVIHKIAVSEGEVTEKESLLASLDLTEINSRLQQAELAFKKAQRDYARIEILFEDSVVTLEQFQDMKTALEVSRTNLNLARFAKQYSEIRAPSKGKVLKLLKEEDEVVAPGFPVVVFASTEADWVLKVNVPDRDIVRLRKGDSAHLSFDAFPGKIFKGEVSQTSNSANLLSGTYEVEVKLLELPENLVTGLIGSVKIYPESENQIMIQAEGLAEANGNKGSVYRYSGGAVSKVTVDIREIADKGIIISRGIFEGDTIITFGCQWLHDGQEVIISGKKEE